MENYAEYKEKYEEVTAEYEKEKERLTKLYQLYEETDNECKRLKEENANWQNWYNQNINTFNKLFSAAPPVTTATQISPENPIDNPTIIKKKKHILGKN
jgi:Rad3-related DNA helicase